MRLILSFKTLKDIFHIYKQSSFFCCFYINVLITTILTIVRRFPTTFRRFLKIFLNLIGGRTNASEHFSKFSVDNPRLPKTFKEDPKMFRSYTNKFKYNSRNKSMILVKSSCNIFTSEIRKIRHPNRNVVSYEFYEWCIYFPPVKYSCLYQKGHKRVMFKTILSC